MRKACSKKGFVWKGTVGEVINELAASNGEGSLEI
jgi:hypothetical protein